MPAATHIAGAYLTDGEQLAWVVRIEEDGSLMAENAVSGKLFYIEAPHKWRVVEPLAEAVATNGA